MQLLRLLLGLLPASVAKNWLLRQTGNSWQIASTARISPCVLWRVAELTVGERAHVGSGNIFREIGRIEIGADAQVGQLNWVTGAARWIEQADYTGAGCLALDEKAAITSRHYIDCSGGLFIGRLSILAGVRSTVLSHSVDVETSTNHGAPIKIGRECFISACVLITPGTVIADRCVVAAGSIVVKDLMECEALYAGAPARFVRSLSGAKFFAREEARVVPRSVAQARLRRGRKRQGTR